MRSLNNARTLSLLLFLISLLSLGVFAQVPDAAKVTTAADKVIAAATSDNPAPGCAIGISLDGKSVFEKAFGMAELEHRIPNTAQTIFESGSVAKQFVAASIVLLALEGKLSIDDPVKKYLPELPDYGVPLTIRHMLNHTSGLRDWGAVMGITGVGRGDRVVSQALALDIIFHQKGLDFTPGSEYSYSNSGYQLLTTIVERVSKQSLSEFTKTRFFEPLGMTNTSWRVDYQEIVPGRAQAYTQAGKDKWRLLMPFMNVYGNGGMLTTVGDWLKWNKMLETRSMGAPLVEMLETNGVLNDGRKISYALGIVNSEYKGLKEVLHGGSTAGYQTFLTRFPELKMSIAVLCNGTSGNPGRLAHQIVDGVATNLRSPDPRIELAMGESDLAKFAGIWRNEKTHTPIQTIVKDNTLMVVGHGPIKPAKPNVFIAGSVNSFLTFEIDGDSKPKSFVFKRGDDIDRYVAETEWTPTDKELAEFEGDWFSEESGATIKMIAVNSKLIGTQRPDTKLPFFPRYKDHFTLGPGTEPIIWFTRDAAGKVTTLHVGSSRMRDMPFVRVGVN